MKECLLAFLIVMLFFLAIGGCDYVLTKKALTDLQGEEPKPETILWIMRHGNARVMVKK